MIKYLVVIGVIAFVYFVFIKKKPKVAQKKETRKKEDKQSNDMIECKECGIYCELDDTILSNNKYYCSKECVEKS
ncbi:PP0621 family protein [Sulfurimonas sp.]|uniref:PP0621 family protein n=1 Tax=Sulfurimonas sp. TaxID=2022749 RepID=UPI002B478948|nr:PP0621 family protein [Sulfurimonas sp.]